MSWFKNLGITKKLLCAFLLVTAITIGIGVKSIGDLGRMAGYGEAMYANFTRPIGTLGKAVQSYELVAVNVRNILLVTGDAADQKYLGLLRQNEADFEKYLDEVRPTAATEQERAAIAKVDSGWASYKLAMEKVLVPAMADKNDEAWAGMNDPAFLQQLKAVDDAVQALVAAKTKGASDADDENESRYQHAKLISIVTLSVAAILAVGVGLWLARIIAGPITRIINQISDISSTIASAVEELTATTNEMTRNIAEAAKGSSEIAQNIIGVATAAKSTTGGASDTSKAGGELSRMASELQTEVSKFKV